MPSPPDIIRSPALGILTSRLFAFLFVILHLNHRLFTKAPLPYTPAFLSPSPQQCSIKPTSPWQGIDASRHFGMHRKVGPGSNNISESHISNRTRHTKRQVLWCLPYYRNPITWSGSDGHLSSKERCKYFITKSLEPIPLLSPFGKGGCPAAHPPFPFLSHFFLFCPPLLKGGRQGDYIIKIKYLNSH